MARNDLEVREVVSDDASLSPEANRLLTEEARRAVGSDEVTVPRDTPRRSREWRGGRGGVATEFAAHRILIVISFFALLVIGAIVSLSTGSWLAVVLAATLHALGAFVVLAILATAARQTERVDPSVAARLADEGVPDPDAQLSDLVDEYAGAQRETGIADIVTTGANEQTADPSVDPAVASAQQRTVLTPAGSPTVPAGTGSAIDKGLVKGVTIATLVAAVIAGVVAPFVELRMLAIPAIVLPFGLAWFIVQARMGGRREERAGEARQTTEPAPGNGARALASIVATILLVAGFVGLMGWIAGLI